MTTAPDFDRLYAVDTDPWRVGSSPYEQRKLGVVLACLLQPRYSAAWAPACGTGHLARGLADRADRVLATDLSPRAVDLASAVCRGRQNIQLAAHRLPDAPPDSWLGRADLIVLSEFFYYLQDRERIDTLTMLDAVAAGGCEVVAVHWRHVPDDAWLSGAAAQQEIVDRLSAFGWDRRMHHEDHDFVVDTLLRDGTDR